MSLPVLLKYIYDHATHEVIRQGKAIYATGGVTLTGTNPILNTVEFQVTNDTHPVTYKVTVNKYKDTDDLSVECQCTYNLGEICRHEAAALFKLQELLDKDIMDETTAQYNQEHTVIKMKDIDPKTLRLLTSRKNFVEAEKIARHHQAAIKRAKEECIQADLAYQKKIFHLEINRNADRNYETSCNCNETTHPLCKHKAALFLQLLNSYGEYYFDTIKNWDKQKNKLLEQYGYSLSDDLKGKFEFAYVKGKPFLRVLDSSIKHIQNRKATKPENDNQPKTFTTAKQPKKAIVLPQGVRSRNLTGGIDNFLTEQKHKSSKKHNRLGVVLSTSPDTFPHLQIDIVSGEANDTEDLFVGTVQKMDLSRYIDYYSYSRDDRDLIAPIRKLQASELTKYLNRNSPYAGLWEHLYVDEQSESAIPQDTQKLILEYMLARLKRLFPLLIDHQLVYLLPQNAAYRSSSLLPVGIREERIRPEFEVTKEKNTISLSCYVQVNGEKIPVHKSASRSPLLFLHDNEFSLVNSVRDAMVMLPYLNNNPIAITEEAWPRHLEEDILPLSQKYKVHFSPSLVEKSDKVKPQPCISFKELNNMLLIQPQFQYNNEIVDWDEGQQITTISGDKVLLVKRDKEAENTFIESIRKSHTRFERPTNHNYFHLQSKEALSRNWFLNFMDMLQENNVLIKGLNRLKKFRFNKNRPETKLEISSDIDWFDAKIDVRFGEQMASIRAIKKALSRKQNFIPLGDGSLGILPEQWMEKYGLLFRMGQESENGLRVSKYNFGIIDELYDHIDDESLIEELNEKKRALLDYDELPAIPIPANMKTVMRNYQESGLQWLNYLDDIKWGGILADDMGLGKTLQALSFLQHFKNQTKQCFALVVCPTSLIYNWENEIKKFTPDLTYHIHHGPNRIYNTKTLKTYDIILTSYGTLRSDIQLFVKFELDYAILDESQFIKNPQSKVTKAARLLNASNRFCLSGTPMQNNTFDIYSQMNFLNPGMLGSIDFFKNEFSQPIDKNEDEGRKAHLRKLIYPFILRRTKEQVARDLPEKSEMVLFCDMNKDQREIYESYRHLYRSRILGTIDEQGLGRSQFTILQGLMKLRQICDSPAILKDESYDNYSVKLDELSREIQENTGNHKVLIFSQFLGMLKLIKDKLRGLHIPYEYFDGSTTPKDREKAIYNFQNDEKARVFLISLKAGGVGLNLTAADYVYIVDPWWNPAVEQQAIDRTHRIGQTKNIFAYRMICKNTIEEKILQLQEKKKSLVKDVISDENGFVKKLTKEDVLYLFS